MEDRTTGQVDGFDHLRGYMYIHEAWTGDCVFISRWSVKRVTLPEWHYNLHRSKFC